MYQGMIGIILYSRWEENKDNDEYDKAIKHLDAAMKLDPSCHIYVLYYCKVFILYNLKFLSFYLIFFIYGEIGH